MLTRLKRLLGITDDERDAVLIDLIERCKAAYKKLTHTDKVDNDVVLEMAAFQFSKLGATAISAESFSGASFTYLQDYPADLYRQIVANRRVRTL